MRERALAVHQPVIQGKLTDVLSMISTSPIGRALAAVLDSIELELGSVNVRISSDLRRATVHLPNRKLATVRVTSAKPQRVGGMPYFRFRTPAHSQRYDRLYFGGIAGDGRPIVYKFTPSEIGDLQTLTLKCS